MEPSFNALQLLRELRKAEKDWRRDRWLYLLVNLALIGGAVYAFSNIDALAQLSRSMFGEKSLEAGFYLYLGASAVLILAGFGALGLGYVIRNWRGDRTRQLLIEMAERELVAKRRSIEPVPREF